VYLRQLGALTHREFMGTAGKVRTEGKDYAMSDGHVVEFRFNV